jgi:hypothetical protein
VIEHLEDIPPFVAAAARCARSGGAVLVSVPNRERLHLGIDPFDFPPHHVSRWAVQDLEELGRRLALGVVDVAAQRRTPSSIARAAPAMVRRLPGKVRKHQNVASSTATPGPRMSPWHRLRRLTYDHTMLARYRAP